MVKKTDPTPQANLLADQDPTADTTTDPHAALSAVPVCEDVVEYTLRCALALAPQLSAAVRQSIQASASQQVRGVFGGDRAYISHRQGEGRYARNAQIRRDYKGGERIALLQRRYNLSAARIWQIIGE
jgi:Mor family transcriptional regulator